MAHYRSRNLIFAVLTVVLFFVASELIARGWENYRTAYHLDRRFGHSEALESGRLPPSLTPDPLLGWRHRSESSHDSLHLNSWGFRGEEVELAKPAGTLRVIATGDSAGAGYGVDIHDLYTTLAQQRLAACGGGTYEVINAAVGGYTSFQVRAQVEERLLGFAPDVITIMCGVNDFFEPLYLPDRYCRRAPETFRLNMLLARSAAYRLLKRELFPLFRGIYYALASEQERSSFDKRVSGPEMVKNIEAVADLGLRRGFKVLLFEYPASVVMPEYRHPFAGYQERAAEHPNVELLPIRERFIEEIHAGRNPMQRDGGHPNELGNRIMADELVRALERLNYVDCRAAADR